MALRLLSDVGWIAHLTACVVYFFRNGFHHALDYAGVSSELVRMIAGGLLNFASGLPIYCSFKKGIFYGVQ